jgi:membrane dipeptidase
LSAPTLRSRAVSRRTLLRLLATASGGLACRWLGALSSTPTPGVVPDKTALPSLTPTVVATATASPEPTLEAQSTATLPASIPQFIVDAHEDIAWNWLEFGRDPTESALEVRAREAGTAIPRMMGQRTIGLPEWLQGRVGIIFATLFVMPLRHAYSGSHSQVYTTAEEAHARATEQLDKYKELAARESQLRLITTTQELEEVLATWTAPDNAQPPTVGLVMSMEGADPIREPAEVREWYAQGLRIVGPAWVSTRYSGGTGEPGPLTDLGRQLLEAMADVGMILDLSHIAEEAYLEAVDAYPGTIIASHSNPRAFLPTDRGLSDEMILRLAGRGGVVGISPYNVFLKPGWRVGNPRTDVPVQTVAEAIDYVVQLTGSTACVGLGSDFDGGFGVEAIPAEMDTIADLSKIAEALSVRGYRPVDVEMIMNGNWLRILRNSLP